MKKNKTILIDLDDTLCKYIASRNLALNETLFYIEKQFSINSKALSIISETSFIKLKNRFSGKTAKHSRLIYFQQVCESLKFKDILLPLFLEKYFWNQFFKKIKPYDGVISFLKFVKNDFKVCILSNFASSITYEKIEKLGIAKYIDYIVTSEEVGEEKPNPLTFLYALDKVNCCKENAIMIGDNYINDIQGARSLGIKTIHITPEEKNPEKKGPIWFNDFFQLTEYFENEKLNKE